MRPFLHKDKSMAAFKSSLYKASVVPGSHVEKLYGSLHSACTYLASRKAYADVYGHLIDMSKRVILVW